MHIAFSSVRNDGDAKRFDVICNGIVLGECQRYTDDGVLEWCCDYAIEWLARELDHCEHGYIHGHTRAGSLKAALRKTLKRGAIEQVMEARHK